MMPREMPSKGERTRRGFRAATVSRGQQVLHALLGDFLLPAQDGDLVEAGLSGLHDESAVVKEGPENAHRTIEEKLGVVVVGRTGEEFNVERALGGAVELFAILVGQPQAIQQRVALSDADLEVVEGDVEVNVFIITNEAVVSDDRDVLCPGGVELARESRAVDGGDDQHGGPIGDHLVDLLGLGGDVIVCELGGRPRIRPPRGPTSRRCHRRSNARRSGSA